MGQLGNRWGVELSGEEHAKEVWRSLLKLPFDPFVEQVKDASGNYLALRSSAFEVLVVPAEVHQAANQLFKTLNVAIANSADADPVQSGAVVEFGQGEPKRHNFIEVEGIAAKLRGAVAQLDVKDDRGHAIVPPRAPSTAQLWIQAARIDHEIGSAIRYLDGKPGWVELYKAYEALKALNRGSLTNAEVTRFTQTANAGERHHTNFKTQPHTKPMELWEGQAMITRWISAAVIDVLRRNS